MFVLQKFVVVTQLGIKKFHVLFFFPFLFSIVSLVVKLNFITKHQKQRSQQKEREARAGFLPQFDGKVKSVKIILNDSVLHVCLCIECAVLCGKILVKAKQSTFPLVHLTFTSQSQNSHF